MVIPHDQDKWIPPPPDKEEKFCKKCQLWKPLTEFWKRGSKSKYYAGYCKQCHTKPFEYESIHCPHCKAKITFFGIDGSGNITRQKSAILNKLKNEAKEAIKVRNVKKEKQEIADKKNKVNLTDFFSEE